MVLSVKKEKQAPLHHRKRHGHHHKRTKQYEKHYWPYLPLLSIIGLGFILNLLWTPLSHSMISHDILGYAANTSVVGLLDETNSQRTGSGVASLQLNSQLNQAAQAKAEDMASRDYWSHTTPDGKEPWWFVTNVGYTYASVGENLAYGFSSSSTTIAGWMNSPGHRSNLLNDSFRDVGFGIAQSPNYVASGPQTIIVAMYGAANASVSSPSNPQPVTISPAASPTPATASLPVANTQPAAPTPSQSAGPTINGAPQATATPTVAGVTTEPQSVTRLQTVASSLPAEGVASTILVVAAAAALFIFRHTRALHRKLVKGEKFVIQHPLLDMAFVAIITLGLLLTRTAGFIN